jgi:hypothetical protein
VAAFELGAVLMPVAWEHVEAKEGGFRFQHSGSRIGFSILDHVSAPHASSASILGGWVRKLKNAFSEYAGLDERPT